MISYSSNFVDLSSETFRRGLKYSVYLAVYNNAPLPIRQYYSRVLVEKLAEDCPDNKEMVLFNSTLNSLTSLR